MITSFSPYTKKGTNNIGFKWQFLFKEELVTVTKVHIWFLRRIMAFSS